MNERERLIELLDHFNRDISKYAGNPKLFVVDDNTELADYLLANGVTVQRWIPASEPPEEGVLVLTLANGKPCENITLHQAYELGRYGSDGEWFVEGWPEWYGAEVTHWQPYPKPPKEE